MTELQLKRILSGITAARQVVEQYQGPPNALVMTCAKVFATAQLRAADLINQRQHEAAGLQAPSRCSAERLPLSIDHAPSKTLPSVEGRALLG